MIIRIIDSSPRKERMLKRKKDILYKIGHRELTITMPGIKETPVSRFTFALTSCWGKKMGIFRLISNVSLV